jgi:hypothetical protein
MRRSSSVPKWADFFFEPLELHLQPADLLVEFLFARLGGCGVGVGRLGEERRQPLGHLLFPEAHLRGMHPVPRRNGVHRVDVLERFQPDLGFQRGTMQTSFLGHGGGFLFGLSEPFSAVQVSGSTSLQRKTDII